jgi:hypothetical protein
LLTRGGIFALIAIVKFELPKEMVEKMRLIMQPHPNPLHGLGQKLRDAAEAQKGLPQQIENLSGQIGKLVAVTEVQTEIAKFQAQLAEESAKETKSLSEQTDRLVQETINLARFTRGIFWFTVILGFFALVQIVVMLFQYFSNGY